MASNGNMNRAIQLIIDVIGHKMTLCIAIAKVIMYLIFLQKVSKYKRPAFKGRCLVGMLSVHAPYETA